MNKLPVEVFCHILSRLHYQDKIQCTLVCQEWCRVIENTNLFRTLIVTTMDCLNKLINKFQQYPQFGAQVNHLVLDLCFDESYNLDQFTMLLPNLRFLSCRNKGDTSIQHSNAEPWNTCIEQIMDESNCAIIPQLFMSNAHFVSLKRLSIKNTDFLYGNFIELLSQASALSHLEMKCDTIYFHQMNLLHSTLPLLESLDLIINHSLFSELPVNINPASTITSFFLHFEDLVSLDMKWFTYIRRKYTHLLNFAFSSSKGAELVSNMENTDKNWFEPFFKHFGSQLKSLSIHSHQVPSHLIEMLDRSGCQLKHLRIKSTKPRLLEYFEGAQHLDQIQTFEIEFDTCTVYEWMRKMTSLKELSVFYFDAQSDFDLRHLLAVCSDTLTSLSIWIKYFYINDKSENKVYPLIKSLIFSNTVLPLRFSHFISQSFPNLRHLKLSECHFPEKTLRLYNLRLNHFEIEVCHFEKEYNLRVVTSKNDQQRLYTFKLGHNRPLYPEKERHLYRAPFTSVLYKDMEHTPSLNLACYSVCSLSVLYKYF